MKKNIFLGIALLIAGGIISFVLLSKPDFIDYRDTGLSQTDREIFEGRVRESKSKIENFTGDTSVEEKFRTYVYLARAQFSLGNLVDAEKNYEEAIDLDYDGSLLSGAWYELFSVRYHRQDYENAKEAIQKAIDLAPNNVEYWRALVDLEHDGFKASDETIKNLHLFAIQESDNHPDIIAMYAIYLESKGDLRGALEQWKRILEIRPDNPSVEEQIKRLEQQIK